MIDYKPNFGGAAAILQAAANVIAQAEKERLERLTQSGPPELSDEQIRRGLAEAAKLDSTFEFGDGSTADQREAACITAFRAGAYGRAALDEFLRAAERDGVTRLKVDLIVCGVCGGSGLVPDGEIASEFGNEPIKCVRYCPTCGGKR